MSNPEHHTKLNEGVEAWNSWKQMNAAVRPDLSNANLYGAILSEAYLTNANLHGADLREADLSGAYLSAADLREADLSGADLSGADLSGAYLREADLREADLSGADLSGASLNGANLREADLSNANLYGANLSEAYLTNANLHKADLREADLSGAYLSAADLSEAKLSGAKLSKSTLVEAKLEGADLTDCNVYGISVWNARLDGAKQSNLVITRWNEPAIQVDNLEVAQFIYLLLNNAKIRRVIDTIASKVVLILGRFTQERKVVLDAIREELRKRDYVPVLFDFEKPASKDLTGTISTLANMARFIIADLTDPASVPHELRGVASDIVVPIQTIILEGHHEYAMFADLKRRYHWVLEPFQYKSLDSLLDQLNERVIDPAEAKAKELRNKVAGTV
jgi:uncharacterized protein YjbI with pentapeptide repeats